MNIFNKLDRYLTNTTYKIIILPQSINIINYKEIKDFNNNKIIVLNQFGTTTITGEDLVVSKMQDNEILITGKITSVNL